jgi:WD40 repeat protein
MCVWDAKTLAPLQRIQAHAVCLSEIALSPTTDVAATASCDKLIKLWDTTTWQCIGELVGHTIEVGTCAFSPDGTLLATASCRQMGGADEPAEFKLWDVSKRQCTASWRSKPNTTMKLAFADGGRSLVAGYGSGEILQWDIASRPPLPANVVFTNSLPPAAAPRVHNAVTVSPDLRQLTYITADEHSTKLVLVDLIAKSSRILATDSYPYAVGAFSPDGRWLAHVGNPNEVRLYSTRTGSVVGTFTDGRDRIFSLAFSPDGRMLAAGSHDAAVFVHDVSFPREIHHQFAANSANLAIDSDCRHAYLANMSGEIEVRDLATGEAIRVLALPGYHATDVINVSPDERWACFVHTDGLNGSSVLVDLNDETCVKVLGSPSSWPAFSRDSRLLGRLTERGVSVSELTSGRVLWETPLPREVIYLAGDRRLEFSEDGRQLAVPLRGEEKRCLLFDVGAGSQRDFGRDDDWLRLSSSGRSALRFNALSGLDIVDGQAANLILNTNSPTSAILVADLSPDGRTIAGTSSDGTLRLWHMASGHELCIMASAKYPLVGCRFSRDGRTLVAWSYREPDRLLDFHVFRVTGPQDSPP